MAIVKPENMKFSSKNIILILSGLPGTGKTTLALSAPDVLLIDADDGLARVNPAHRRERKDRSGGRCDHRRGCGAVHRCRVCIYRRTL